MGMASSFHANAPIQFNSTSQGLPYGYNSIMSIYKSTDSRMEDDVFIAYGPALQQISNMSHYDHLLDYYHILFLYCEGKHIHHHTKHIPRPSEI